jgi:hypothetical protein
MLIPLFNNATLTCVIQYALIEVNSKSEVNADQGCSAIFCVQETALPARPTVSEMIDKSTSPVVIIYMAIKRPCFTNLPILNLWLLKRIQICLRGVSYVPKYIDCISNCCIDLLLPGE